MDGGGRLRHLFKHLRRCATGNLSEAFRRVAQAARHISEKWYRFLRTAPATRSWECTYAHAVPHRTANADAVRGLTLLAVNPGNSLLHQPSEISKMLKGHSSPSSQLKLESCKPTDSKTIKILETDLDCCSTSSYRSSVRRWACLKPESAVTISILILNTHIYIYR